jgi:hypothetical protein
MKKGAEKSSSLTDWGASLLNKLPSVSRDRRKRDASKRRRERARKAVGKALDDD